MRDRPASTAKITADMSKPVLILRLLIPLLIAMAAVAGYLGVERGLSILKPDRIIDIDDLPGISGVVFGPGCSILTKSSQHLVSANEHPPALVFRDVNFDKQERTLLLGPQSVSSVIAGGQGELLLVSRENGLMMLDAQGNVVGKGWRPVSYPYIASAAFVPNVGLTLCATRTPEKLLIFSSINSWQDLLDAFKNRR